MKKLALLVAICLAFAALPFGTLAEEAISPDVEVAPGEAVGETGAPGLFAEEDADGEPEGYAWVEAAPEMWEEPAEPEELETDIAAPADEAPGAEQTPQAVDAAEAQPEPAVAQPEPETPHVDPNGPALSANEITLGVGEQFALAPALPEGATGEISLATSDAAVAGVDAQGLVTAVAPGEARITAALGDAYCECFVHVRKAPDEIAFASATFKLGKGERTDAPKLRIGSVEGEFAGACSFKSSKPKIVKVEADGTLKGLKTGKATITATSYNGMTASCKVQVVKAPGKVTASADKARLGVGETGVIGYKLPKGTAGHAEFKSENEAVLIVDPATGEMTGVSPGETRVRVTTYNKRKAYVKVKVAPAPETLSFAAESLRVGVGMKLGDLASVNEGAAGEISYQVADAAFAACEKGVLKGLAPGETTLTATAYNGMTAQCPLTVTEAPKKVTLPWKTLNIGVKQQFALQPDAGGCASTFRYSTSNKKIVTVSADGVLKGIKKGSATVTVKTYNGKSFKLKVKVLAAPGSVSVTPRSLELGIDEKAALTAKLPGKTAAGITYSSADAGIAAVDPATGEVTGVAPGETKITAKTHNGKKATASVTVYAKPEWIEAENGILQLAVDQKAELAFRFSPGSRSPLSFASQDPAVATVSSDGVVRGAGPGQTVITVQTNAPGVETQVSVTVWPAPDSLSLEYSKLTMNAGDTITLKPIIPDGTLTEFSFASSNTDVATISAQGDVVALARGTATLGVKTHNDLKATMKLTVEDPWYPEKVKLTNAPEHMLSGESLQLEWTVQPEGAVADLVWSSSSKKVATVDENGLIKAVGFGYAKISATSKRNSDIKLEFTLMVETDGVTLTIPARTTDIAGIPGNLALIDDIRACAISQIDALLEGEIITDKDAAKRKSMVNNAFADYAFPWMTPELQVYWKAANSENGAKDFKPDRVYYGIPYISGSGTNRQYNAAKALAEGRYTDSGAGYYLLNQDKLLNGKYCGNDCSCFVDAAIWGTNSSHSADRTAEIAKIKAYKTIKDFKAMRTGDLICKGYAHVVMFLYYADVDKTKIMIIENGGSEPGTNTVHCIVMDLSYYTSKGYSVRRLASLG